MGFSVVQWLLAPSILSLSTAFAPLSGFDRIIRPDLASTSLRQFSSLADRTTDSTEPHLTETNDQNSQSPSKPPSKSRNTVSFNQGLNDVAESCGNPGLQVIRLAQKCQNTFESMKESSPSTIDIVSLNTVLKAWAKAGATLAETTRHGHMLDSNVPVYTPRDCAGRAFDLLNNEDLVTPDITSYNTVMDAWAKSGADEAIKQTEALFTLLRKHETMDPTPRSYTALIEVYSKSDVPDRMERIERVWTELQRLTLAEKSSMKITIHSINMVLHAWAKYVPEDHSYADRCVSVLKDMTSEKSATPDFMTYTTVMDALGRVGSVQAAEKAGELFDELKGLYESTQHTRYKPSAHTYVTLITAWSKSKSADSVDRVEAILKDLLEDPGVAPNSRAFTAVLSTWSRSGLPNQAQRAVQILQQMKQLAPDNMGASPTLYTYHAALECCARTKGAGGDQITALRLAFVIYKSLEADKRVNTSTSTFVLLMRAAMSLLPAGDERNKVGIAVFEKAKTNGQVNQAVVSLFESTVEREVSSKLLSSLLNSRTGKTDIGKAPASWTKNISS